MGGHAPRPVRRAVACMMAGALVQAVSTLVAWLDRDDTRAQTARLAHEFQRRTLPAGELERATDQARWFGLVTGAFFVVLWLLVARLCLRGRASGRTCATVLAIVYTFTFLLSGVRSFGPGALIGAVTMTLGLATVYLLWRRPVTPWLSSQGAARAARRTR